METEAAKRIWRRSIDQYNIRYTGFLSDWDAKAYDAVVTDKPYGDEVDIVKEECCNHVSKRMGNALKKLTAECKARNESISGRNKLTAERIITLQNYYGAAIKKNNTHNLEAMYNAVWATLFHVISTDEDPRHWFCPVGVESWCWFKRAEFKGQIPAEVKKHTAPLPHFVAEKLETVYRRLSNKDLLTRCLGGKTQNPNESVNSVIWNKCPKTTFVSATTVRIGACMGVLQYNKGFTSQGEIMAALNLTPCSSSVLSMQKKDSKRKRLAESRVTESSKRRRLLRVIAETRGQQHLTNSEGVTYGAGMF